MTDVSSRFCSKLAKLSDAALLGEVARVSRAHRALTAELVAHLSEMDARKLYLSEATPSMFVYCVTRLRFSEDEACRRIDAARAARKWPVIFQRIEEGRLSLTVLGKLKPMLTDENVEELVNAVAGKSVREAERILAARFPKPDTRDSIRKLPSKPVPSLVSVVAPGIASAPAAEPPLARESAVAIESVTAAESLLAGESAAAIGVTGLSGSVPAETPSVLVAIPTAPSVEARTAPPVEDRPVVDRGKLQSLSADRVQVKFTASRVLEEKLELARDLMSHRNPRGDLATIVEAGLDLLIAQLSKQKLGQTARPQKKRRPAKRAHVANATKREVVDRDGLGCCFVNERGERCGARAFLEFDHEHAKGKGGGSEEGNVRLLCRGHNQGEAERVYGKEHMERSRRRKRSTDVREVTSTQEFVVGFANPRRRGSSSSAGRTNCTSSNWKTYDDQLADDEKSMKSESIKVDGSGATLGGGKWWSFTNSGSKGFSSITKSNGNKAIGCNPNNTNIAPEVIKACKSIRAYPK